MRPSKRQVVRLKRSLLPVFERLLRAQLISNARQSRSWTAYPLIKLVISQRSLLAMRWRRSRERPPTRRTAVPQSSPFGVWAHFWELRSLMVVRRPTAVATELLTSASFLLKCLTRLRFTSPNQRNTLRVR